MICMNLGSGTREEARKWVEYVNGAPTTPQGARRAANGHRDPYPPTIWELGTSSGETTRWGGRRPPAMPPATWNSTRWCASKLSLARYWLPVARADFTPAWNAALIKQAGKDLSYVSVHYVVTLSNLVAKPPDADTQTASLWPSRSGWRTS